MKNRAYCINLQRDEGEEYCPDWVEKVDLSSFTASAAAISSCEMVVTSCTCIAHLAGAMGVPTMVIVPVVPYYLWTLPGTSTPYYNSVNVGPEAYVAIADGPKYKLPDYENPLTEKELYDLVPNRDNVKYGSSAAEGNPFVTEDGHTKRMFLDILKQRMGRSKDLSPLRLID